MSYFESHDGHQHQVSVNTDLKGLERTPTRIFWAVSDEMSDEESFF
jgi:hypothetical protein